MTIEDAKKKICEGGPTLIFSCSGAADVWALSDLAARKLTSEGAGKMYCLPGIGSGVQGIMQTTQNAAQILAIDGYGFDCLKYCLEEAGFAESDHMRVTDLGLEKGRSPATGENIKTVARISREKPGF